MSYSKSAARPAGRPAGKRGSPSIQTHEVVDPRWLIKAFLVMLLVALVCGYLSLCALFYQGAWQLVLHPVKNAATPPDAAGIPFQSVRFGAGATGVPQLTGWWIPAGPGAAFTHLTILYLPGGDGSLAGDQAALARLHEVGAAIFAIDYRGFGQSSEFRPGERSMSEDAESAWTYLTGSRGLPAERIVPYGRGVGASLALNLAAAKPSAPALILDAPEFDVEGRVRTDPRSHFLPVHLLFHDRFALLPALNALSTPKLIVTRSEREDPAVLAAADPKMTIALPPSATDQYAPALKRFLAAYAPPATAPMLVPTPAPRAR